MLIEDYQKQGVLLSYPQQDLAVIGIQPELLAGLPEAAVPLLVKGTYILPGSGIGWCGFPAIPTGDHVCFFGGWVSLYKEDEGIYFVDGTVINGVSGGPAFVQGEEGAGPYIVGVVSAYYPNYSSGQPLPGLGTIVHIHPFHGQIEKMQETWDNTVARGAAALGKALEESDTPVDPSQPEGSQPDQSSTP